jgi:hypothetical protein
LTNSISFLIIAISNYCYEQLLPLAKERLIWKSDCLS